MPDTAQASAASAGCCKKLRLAALGPAGIVPAIALRIANKRAHGRRMRATAHGHQADGPVDLRLDERAYCETGHGHRIFGDVCEPQPRQHHALDPVIALAGVGALQLDAADALANIAGSAILIIAVQLNVPKIVLIRMGLNVAANALIGAIPILGDIFSIWFRSNAKNADLLERYAGSERRRAGLDDWLFVAGIISAVVLIGFGIILMVVWVIGWLGAAWGRAF